MLKVFVPREAATERRVAATPETVRRMVGERLGVTVERGAGAGAFISDGQYEEAGAQIAADGAAAWEAAEIVLKVGAPALNDALGRHEADAVKAGAVVIGLLAPHRNLEMVRKLAERKVTALALELIPRITRAQAMDALSSQASIAGYKAVLLAAGRLGKYFPLLMTAAGTVPPARVLVLGAGVAGLQAIATARRLGAVVEAADIRPAAKEEVESLGGKFIALPAPEGDSHVGGQSASGRGAYAKEVGADVLRAQQNVLREHVARTDAVIATALVPGRASPRLVTAEMVAAMRPGAVIVDIAVDPTAAGPGSGNCELSLPDGEAMHGGVLVIGHGNLAATVPVDASLLYARNVQTLVRHIVREGQLALKLDDEIIRGVLLTHDGKVLHEPTAALLNRSC